MAPLCVHQAALTDGLALRMDMGATAACFDDGVWRGASGGRSACMFKTLPPGIPAGREWLCWKTGRIAMVDLMCRAG
jgi:hypothetical protein